MNHHIDRHLVWAMRLALAMFADNTDAYRETCAEINEHGCWVGVAVSTQAVLLSALQDRYTTPDGVDLDECVAWIQHELDNELNHLEHDP